MIQRKLLIVTAIIGSVVITACSDMTAPAEKIQHPRLAGTVSFAVISTPCPAPGTGSPGALNMLHDPTMFATPMARNAPQGNDGMFHAVAVSGC